MEFFDKIGTKDVKFVIKIVLDKLCINMKVNNYYANVVLIRGYIIYNLIKQEVIKLNASINL